MRAPTTGWRILQGDVLIGTLFLMEVDQPWFMCRFEPAEAWGSVRALFETQDEMEIDPLRADVVEAAKAVRNLGLEIHRLDNSEVIRPWILLLPGRPRFRY